MNLESQSITKLLTLRRAMSDAVLWCIMCNSSNREHYAKVLHDVDVELIRRAGTGRLPGAFRRPAGPYAPTT